MDISIKADTVIIGFTGNVGSGCTYIAMKVNDVSSKSYKYYKVSDILRTILAEEGNSNPSVEELQNKGDQLRRDNGPSYLITRLFKDIIELNWDEEKDYGIIIDGIKNEGEVFILRPFPYFFLISVQAFTEVRRARAISDRKFEDNVQFDEADLREQRQEYEYGQQVNRCSDLADIIILNNDNIPNTSPLRKAVFVRSKYEKFIKLIENLADHIKSVDNNPSINELCMTMAYVISRSSSCLKRKVGALVVDIDGVKDKDTQQMGTQIEIPSVVSSGYNEVPLGSFQCVFHPEYEMCYRDYLQETFAKNLVYCPKCGTKIEYKEVECPHCKEKYSEFVKICRNCRNEIDYVFNCTGCGEKIFDLYIPGNKDAPGKLLDMCRALHAEETSLIKLSKKNGENSSNRVLYVTTQPCPLCANKIVLSGIKKVLYAEPYSMKQSEEILKNGRVDVERFEGAKSVAYFKLYQ